MNIRLFSIALFSLFVISDGRVGESRRLPQTTTTTKEIGFFGVFDSQDICTDPYGTYKFKTKTICSEYERGSDSFAHCFVSRFVRAALGQKAVANALWFAQGSAVLSATQHGNNGALFEVHLSTSESAMTLSTARSITVAAAGPVKGKFVAFSRAADPGTVCDWVNEMNDSKPSWWWKTYRHCYCDDGSSTSCAIGSVEAFSKSTSLANATAISTSSSSTDVDVEGSNIHNVKAKIVNGFSSFTYARGRSWTKAYVDIITTAISSASFDQNCEDEFYDICETYLLLTNCSAYDPAEFCNTAKSYAVSSAELFAEAKTTTIAEAVSRTELTLIYNAEVDKSPGNPLTLGLSGSVNGIAGIGASAYCS